MTERDDGSLNHQAKTPRVAARGVFYSVKGGLGKKTQPQIFRFRPLKMQK